MKNDILLISVQDTLPLMYSDLENAISRILLETNINIPQINNDQELQGQKVEVILKTVLNLHNKLLMQDFSSQEDMKQAIMSMKQEIVCNVGVAMTQEVSLILQKMAGMTELIQGSFLQFKKMFKDTKDELIREISKERPRTSMAKENQPLISKNKMAQPNQLKRETPDVGYK